MEANEIMVNEEVMEATPEIVSDGSGKVIDTIAGIAIAGLVGFGIYKLAKKIYTKVKTKRDLKKQIEEVYDNVEAADNAENIEEDSE